VLILVVKILILWCAAAVAVGFGLGFVLGMAERAHQDEFLNAIFAELSGKNTAN
jgi:hypothetical protein